MPISAWKMFHRNRVDHLTIRTYFHNAQGLKSDARVRANGLDVGSVKAVTLSSHLREQPVEVLLTLDARSAAKIPTDATAMIATEGLLGPSYVEIDVSKTSGGPIRDNGVLKGMDSVPLPQAFLNAFEEQSDKLASESQKLRETIDSQKSRTSK